MYLVISRGDEIRKASCPCARLGRRWMVQLLAVCGRGFICVCDFRLKIEEGKKPEWPLFQSDLKYC